MRARRCAAFAERRTDGRETSPHISTAAREPNAAATATGEKQEKRAAQSEKTERAAQAGRQTYFTAHPTAALNLPDEFIKPPLPDEKAELSANAVITAVTEQAILSHAARTEQLSAANMGRSAAAHMQKTSGARSVFE